jgi:hypothetical protein
VEEEAPAWQRREEEQHVRSLQRLLDECLVREEEVEPVHGPALEERLLFFALQMAAVIQISNHSRLARNHHSASLGVSVVVEALG